VEDQDDGEDEARDEGSTMPWLILLAVFIAVVAGWWAWRKANAPIPGAEPPTSLTPTRPIAKVDSGFTPAAAIDAGAAEFDAGVSESSSDAGTVPEAPANAGASLVDAGVQAPPDVEVRIESQPAADLFLEGQLLGRTPWSGRLPPGRKTFRFENKAALLNAFRTVTVKADPVSESFTFEKGKVSVKAPEGAAIFIDGTRVGTAPIRGEIPVYEGSHRISVTYGKAKWGEPFTLYPEQSVTFDVELQ
jgi:hypothetical protein